jgi:DNA-binding NtrC family response regulator/Tfp pilus assembly protein PilF
LGEKTRFGDPASTARRIRELSRSAIVLVLGSVEEGTWDDLVLGDLESDFGQLLLVRIEWEGNSPEFSLVPNTSSIRVTGDSPDDLRVFWQGVVDYALLSGQIASISGVQSLVGSANSSCRAQKSSEPLTQRASDFFASIRLFRCSYPVKDLPADLELALSELLRAGLVGLQDGLLVNGSDEPVEQPSASQLLTAASLLTRACDDSLAIARAASLLLQAGEASRASEWIERANALRTDASVRRDVLRIWLQSLGLCLDDSVRPLALRAAGFCLDHDEVDLALAYAQVCASGLKDLGHELSMVMGRVQLARGDLLAAQMSFERALNVASDPSECSRAHALLAEVAYLRGDHVQAESLASLAIGQATDSSVRLEGRNILGKLLLAQSAWDKADSHFALDENDASCVGDHQARMRAKVNRAISLLSQGRAEQARAMLDSVLAEASSIAEPRAYAFALSNLAVLAIERNDFVQALDLSERAIEARRRLGDKVGLARVITNLAELRLRLGLIDEAEQALRFGRRVLSVGILATRAAQLSLVEASILFARGNTAEASRFVGAAIASAKGYTDGAFVGECHRLAARIALEDGDLSSASRSLEAAEQSVDSAYAQAEVEILRAHCLRALGQDAVEASDFALRCARDCRDNDLLLEANFLVAQARRLRGDLELARKHLTQANTIRDKVAHSLPLAMRRNYLDRRTFTALANLDALLAREESGDKSTASSQAKSKVAGSEQSLGFVGRHPSVLKLWSQIRKIAPIPSPVLIHGESGTGKELIANAIHKLSDRRDGPLVKVNCAALVESLLLSELFGHEKGAFTGAGVRRVGRFEMASGGTLFLDEIGDISPKTQVALLRVLQEKTFERVGGTSSIRADVRIICATHRDLEAMVAEGTFREDLYYRLRAFVLEVTPLRARLSDIELISEHLLCQIASERAQSPKVLDAQALEALQSHSWPGNIRELENTLRAASVFADSEEISADAIFDQLHVVPASRVVQPLDAPPSSVVSFRGPITSSPEESAKVAYDTIRSGVTSLADLKHHIEQECIQRALAETGGNITRAAALLGMKRPRLSQLVKQYGMLENISEEC